MAARIFLGPQNRKPMIKEALASVARRTGRLRSITAGWEEREGECEELIEHLGEPVDDLGLFQKGEALLAEDRDLAESLRVRRDRLHRLRQLYQVRLAPMLAAARDLFSRPADEDVLLARENALKAIAALDAHHQQRLRLARTELNESHGFTKHAGVRALREHFIEELEDCSVLLLAGGHVRLLTEWMRLLMPAPRLRELDIIAWSAGAMALSERVILFHDSPPQGAGDPELFSEGLGTVSSLVLLPHAGRRLQLEDPVRVALLARRLAPATCVTLDEDARVDWNGGDILLKGAARRLDAGGQVLTGEAA
ncbi:MAG: hypothetical protein AAF533_10550 [Acidobacteriota bacterium]